MTRRGPRSAAAALAACVALDAAAQSPASEGGPSAFGDGGDPVQWIFAQARPVASRGPSAGAGDPETASSWTALLFPFAGSGDPVGFAPARWGGTLAFEYLWQKLDDARRRQLLVGAFTVNASSYFWKPWFAQVEGNATVLATAENGDPINPANRTGFTPSAALSGGGTVTVFPASRFPFLASLHSTDSRASGDYAASDYRNTRVTLRQTYRDPLGTATTIGSADYSAISSEAFGRDTVAQLDLRYLGTRDPQRFDAAVNWSRSHQDAGAASEIVRAYGAHLYTPTPDLWVNTLANFTASEFTGASPGTANRLGQLSSQAVWRPEWDERLVMTGGGRFFANRFAASSAGATDRSLSGNLGASFAVTEAANLNASLTATRIDVGDGGSGLVTTGSAGANYTSRTFDLRFASYSFSASAQGGHQGGGREPARSVLGVQADQQLSRTVAFGEAATANLMLTQGGGASDDTLLGRTTTLRFGASAGLRVMTGASSDGYFGASYSQSDSSGGIDDHFQLANVQASGQVRFGLHAALSANLSAQWVRSNRKLFATEETTRQVVGGITFQHTKLFGVPRLRYQLSATFNEGVATSSRLLGDAGAPRENVGQLVDSRLLYDIGRLEIRVGTRFAKVDGRDDLQWYLRIYRHFGQY